MRVCFSITRLALAPDKKSTHTTWIKSYAGGSYKFLCCFAAYSRYCLRLPIQPMLGGGDPNAMLGGHKSHGGLMLLRSKLFLLSPAPNPSNARGR